jgi:hypothetical protein
MGITQITTALTVFVVGLMPASCHKATAQKKSAPSSAAVSGTNSTMRDLGEVTLTNHFETCVQLGAGKDFILRPRMLDGRNIQLTLSLESKTNSGKMHDLSVTQVITRSGKPMEVAVGDFNFSLTPKLSSE